jgi:hypothetical protein
VVTKATKKKGAVKVGKLAKSPRKLTAKEQKKISGGKMTTSSSNWGQNTVGGRT